MAYVECFICHQNIIDRKEKENCLDFDCKECKKVQSEQQEIIINVLNLEAELAVVVATIQLKLSSTLNIKQVEEQLENLFIQLEAKIFRLTERFFPKYATVLWQEIPSTIKQELPKLVLNKQLVAEIRYDTGYDN